MATIDKSANILIVENNCAQLIALTIWLAQFPQLHVQGSMSGNDITESKEIGPVTSYDLIVFSLQTDSDCEFPVDLVLTLAEIRKLKAEENRPAVIVLSNRSTDKQPNNAYRQVNQQLLRESDGQIYWSDSLVDFQQEIIRILSHRRAVHKIRAKAG